MLPLVHQCAHRHPSNHLLQKLVASFDQKSALPQNFEPRLHSVAVDPIAVELPVWQLTTADRVQIGTVLTYDTVVKCRRRFLINGLLVTSLSHWPPVQLTTQSDITYVDATGRARYGTVILVFESDEGAVFCLLECPISQVAMGDVLGALTHPLLQEAASNWLFHNEELWARCRQLTERIVIPAHTV